MFPSFTLLLFTLRYMNYFPVLILDQSYSDRQKVTHMSQLHINIYELQIPRHVKFCCLTFTVTDKCRRYHFLQMLTFTWPILQSYCMRLLRRARCLSKIISCHFLGLLIIFSFKKKQNQLTFLCFILTSMAPKR